MESPGVMRRSSIRGGSYAPMLCSVSKNLMRIPAVLFGLEHQAQGTAIATRRLYCGAMCMVTGLLIPFTPGPMPPGPTGPARSYILVCNLCVYTIISNTWRTPVRPGRIGVPDRGQGLQLYGFMVYRTVRFEAVARYPARRSHES